MDESVAHSYLHIPVLDSSLQSDILGDLMNTAYIPHRTQNATHQMERTVEKCPNQTKNLINNEMAYHSDNQ